MSGPRPKDRMGETKIMKNGMKAVISRYKSSAEIDVQFEDGVTVKNKTYASFTKGVIGHPNALHKSKLRDKTGEVRQMSNGMTAKIIHYTNSKIVDVEFEDGVVRKNCAYKEFKNGHIAHPSQTSESMAKNRLGEKRKMNCGLTATITGYDSYHNVEITFEDGIIISSVDYGQFSSGSISHPKYDGTISLQESSIAYYLKEIGFTKSSKSQLKSIGLGTFELDLYNQEASVAIEIDGRFHRSESALKRDLEKNCKCHNAGIKLFRIREKGLPPLQDGLSYNYEMNGEKLYNGLVDCGAILQEIISVCNLQVPSENFIDFKRDLNSILDYYFSISFNYNKEKIIGTQIFHKPTDQYMKIIDYKDYHHITVQFDDGTIADNKNYGSFKKGEIKHPNHTPEAKKLSRTGEEKRMNCGIMATIVAYRNAEDMDVQFEDGTIRKGVTYFNFQNGNVKNKS